MKKEVRHCADGARPGKSQSHRHLTGSNLEEKSPIQRHRGHDIVITESRLIFILLIDIDMPTRSIEYVSTGLTVVES